MKIDLSTIKGSGENGRILESDLKAPSQDKKPTPAQQQTEQKPAFHGSKVIKMSNFEKGMKKSMTESNTIPHLYLH